MLRRIEQASPIDRRSTKWRSSRLRTRSNEHAQNSQNATRNRHKPRRKYARNVTEMNENLCPERSKEQIRGRNGRTQCSKQHLENIQNVSRIKENRGPEGNKIKENLALDGSWNSFWRLWAIWSEFYAKVDARCAKLGPRWQHVEPQMVHNGV